MTTKAQTQEATLWGFVDAWKNWDPQAYLGLLDDEVKQVTMPFAMGIPPRSRSEVAKVLPILMRTVKNYELTIHEQVQDNESGKAAIYALSKGITPVGHWEVEQALFITFNESRDKIVSLEEMLDTAWMGSFFATKLRPYLKEQGVELH